MNGSDLILEKDNTHIVLPMENYTSHGSAIDAYNRGQLKSFGRFNTREEAELFANARIAVANNKLKEWGGYERYLEPEYSEPTQVQKELIDSKKTGYERYLEPEYKLDKNNNITKERYEDVIIDSRNLWGRLLKGAIGEQMQWEDIWGRALGKSNINLILQYHEGGFERLGPAYDWDKAFAETPEDYGWLETYLESIIGVGADLPTFGIGALIGAYIFGPSPFAIGFSGAAVNEAVKATYLEALERGDVDTFQEWFQIFYTIGLAEGAKSGIQLGATFAAPGVSRALAVGGKYLGKGMAARPFMRGTHNLLVNTGIQVAAFEAVGAAINREFPSWETVAQDALLFGTFNIVGGGQKLLRQKQYRDKLSAPEALAKVARDIELKQGVYSRNAKLNEKGEVIYEDKPSLRPQAEKALPKLEKKLEELEGEYETLDKLNLEEAKAKEELIQDTRTEIDRLRKILNKKEIVIEDFVKPVDKSASTEVRTIERLYQTRTLDDRSYTQKMKTYRDSFVTDMLDKMYPAVQLMNKFVKSGGLGRLNPAELFQLTSGHISRAMGWITDNPITFQLKDVIKDGERAKGLNEIVNPLFVKKVYKEDFLGKKTRDTVNLSEKVVEANLKSWNVFVIALRLIENYKNGRITIGDPQKIAKGHQVVILETNEVGTAISDFIPGRIKTGKKKDAIGPKEVIDIELRAEDGTTGKIVRYSKEEIQSIEKYTMEDIKAAEKVIRLTSPMIKKVAKEVREYNSYILDYLEDSGLVSKKARVLIEEANRNFIPFNKYIEFDVHGKINVSAKRIKGLDNWVGKKMLLQDPMSAVYRNTLFYIQLAERNVTLRKFFDVINEAIIRGEEVPEVRRLSKSELGILELESSELNIFGKELQHKDLGKENLESLISFSSPESYTKGNRITIFREGKREVYEVDPAIHRALTGMNRHFLQMWADMLKAPTKLLRTGATLTPEFFGMNLMRDAFQTAIVSKKFHVPFYASVTGALELFKNHRRVKKGEEKTEWVKKYERSGAMMANFLDIDVYFETSLRKEFTSRKALNELEPSEATKFFGILRNIGSFGESAARMGEFKMIHKKLTKERDRQKKMVAGTAKKLMSDREILERAGFEGKDIIDFSKQGMSAETMNMFSAFFTARLRGYGKMVETFKYRPKEFIGKSLLFISMPSILLWWMNHDDPEYQALSQWEKDLFWNIPLHRFMPGLGITGGEAVFMKIPKPWELGLIFGTGVERAMDWAFDDDKDAITDFFVDFGIKQAQWNMYVLPDFIRVPIEIKTNHSFFTGGPIVPEKFKSLLPEFRYKKDTSEVALFLGSALGPYIGLGAIEIDYFIRAWTGGLGTNTLRILSTLIRGVDPNKNVLDVWSTENFGFTWKNINDVPILKAFFVRNPKLNSSHISKFYKELLKSKEVVNTINRLEKTPNKRNMAKIIKLMQTSEYLIFHEIKDHKKAMAELRYVIDSILAADNLSSDAKRFHIDRLTKLVVQIAINGNKTIEVLKQGPVKQGPVKQGPVEFEGYERFLEP